MGMFISAIKNIVRKPILIWFVAAVMLPVCLINQKFSFLEYIATPKGFEISSVPDTYLTLLQLVVKYLGNSKTFFLVLLSAIVICILIGFVVGTLFSGYFFILNKSINKYKSKKNDYLTGIKRYFLKISITAAAVIFSTGVLFAMLSFIFVPSIVTMNALLAGKAELFFVLILFVIVTIIVLFLSFTFFKTYIVYWFPGCLTFKRKCFKAGVMVANNNFWPLVFALLAFDIVFVGSRILYYISYFSIYSQTVVSRASESMLLLTNWLFLTVYWFIFIYYVFYSFRISRETIV